MTGCGGNSKVERHDQWKHVCSPAHTQDEEGATWKRTRHLERHERGSYHYPAVIQARDGSIHAVSRYFVQGGESMKHARFNEAWVRQGD